MRIDKFFKAVGPILAMAAAGSLAGCDGANIRFNGEEGVPLSELDLSGETPSEITLMGSDIVRISQGEDFTISVDGESVAKDRMRFVLDGEALGIMREKDSWSDREKATVNIVMPAPRKLVIAGSGKMYSDALADDAEVTLAGSGALETMGIATKSLDVNIAGSGRYKASGTTDKLDLSVAGSGDSDMAGLKVGTADINIAGSGNATFASDGDVSAKIAGSGNVTVRGSARCKISSFGSGKLVCERGEPAEAE